MADTLTLQIDDETAEQLRRVAAETGESIEAVAQRLLGEAAADSTPAQDNQLSDEQVEDLKRRLANPGPFASPERVAAVMAKFKVIR